MAIVPVQKPGKSKQDYETPDEFIEAVKNFLEIDEFAIDLAANADNTKAQLFYDEEQDSLIQDWGTGTAWSWLNPPFGHIEPWAKKCVESSPLKIAFLVPAAVGSNWFADHVYGKARILFFRPRLSFDGIAPYPKDCMLCLYGLEPSIELWKWK